MKTDTEILDWLERYIFQHQWDGTIGRSPRWSVVGPHRHYLQMMQGNTFREAVTYLIELQQSCPHPEDKVRALGQYRYCAQCQSGWVAEGGETESHAR
jgi:hypothetical protein